MAWMMLQIHYPHDIWILWPMHIISIWLSLSYCDLWHKFEPTLRYIMLISWSDTIYLFLLCTMTLVGNCGNTMVIGAVLSDRNLRSKEGNMFIMNLAIADLCVTGRSQTNVWAFIIIIPSEHICNTIKINRVCNIYKFHIDDKPVY